MSQAHVERILGRLVTDEQLRHRFWRDPRAAIDELVAAGAELNPCERRALSKLRRDAVDRFVDELDPCIQKADWRVPAES